MSTQYVAVRALNRSANIRVVHPYNVYKLVVDATGGKFALTIANQTAGATDDVDSLAYNISAASLKTALAAAATVPDITTSNVLVSGGPGNIHGTTPYYIQFYGTLLDTELHISAHNAEIAGTNPLTGGGATASVARIGKNVKLSTTVDTVVDLDRADNQRSLAAHSAIGQYIITATNDDIHNDALPANS